MIQLCLKFQLCTYTHIRYTSKINHLKNNFHIHNTAIYRVYTLYIAEPNNNNNKLQYRYINVTIEEKGYFHSTMSMQSLRIGFLRVRQSRARAGLSGWGLPPLRAGLLAAAALAAAAAAASVAEAGAPGFVPGAVAAVWPPVVLGGAPIGPPLLSRTPFCWLSWPCGGEMRSVMGSLVFGFYKWAKFRILYE